MLLIKYCFEREVLSKLYNDQIKNICQIEHSRHRSIDNFYVNILGALIAYSFKPKKPSLNIDFGSDKPIVL